MYVPYAELTLFVLKDVCMFLVNDDTAKTPLGPVVQEQYKVINKLICYIMIQLGRNK